MLNNIEKIMVEIENELEIEGYRLKFKDLKAAAEYIWNNDLEVFEWIEESINDFEYENNSNLIEL